MEVKIELRNNTDYGLLEVATYQIHTWPDLACIKLRVYTEGIS